MRRGSRWLRRGPRRTLDGEGSIAPARRSTRGATVYSSHRGARWSDAIDAGVGLFSPSLDLAFSRSQSKEVPTRPAREGGEKPPRTRRRNGCDLVARRINNATGSLPPRRGHATSREVANVPREALTPSPLGRPHGPSEQGGSERNELGRRIRHTRSRKTFLGVAPTVRCHVLLRRGADRTGIRNHARRASELVPAGTCRRPWS
jgi:hypothetical protein